MKTNKIALIFAMLSVFALTITPVFANGDCNGKEYDSDLIAGRYMDVGDVVVKVDDYEILTIEITLKSGCELIESHVWVGDDLADVPRTKSGNPKIGQFPYTVDDEIDLTDLNDPIYVLIHTVVDCPCEGEETAWGEGQYSTMFSERSDIFGNRWGYFLTLD
jgi:hypothetical protein